VHRLMAVAPQKNSLMHCRILYLVGQLGPGGLERQLFYLIRSMNRERYKPAVAVWNFHEDDPFVQPMRALGIPLFALGRLPGHQKLRDLGRLVRKLRPEILHSYSFYTNFAAWWVSLCSRTVPFGSIRNNFLSDRRLAGRFLGRLSSRWPANQICNSISAKQAVERFAGPFKPSRLQVVANGLDVQAFNLVTTLPSKPNILAVGRLCPEKRWDRLLEVLAVLKESGVKCLVRLVGDGPLRQTLQAQARERSVDHMIEFLGIRKDVPSLLTDSIFLVHTADEEGCPNVVMEAMASGRAVVATDAGDVRVLIQDGQTGFVANRGDTRRLVESMATLIANRQLCATMGQAGRSRAEKEFGLCRLVEQTLQAYCAAGWRK